MSLPSWDLLYGLCVVAPQAVNAGTKTVDEQTAMVRSFAVHAHESLRLIVSSYAQLQQEGHLTDRAIAATDAEIQDALGSPQQTRLFLKRFQSTGKFLFETLGAGLAKLLEAEKIANEHKTVYVHDLLMAAFCLSWLNPLLRGVLLLTHNAWMDEAAKKQKTSLAIPRPPVFSFQTSQEAREITRVCMTYVMADGSDPELAQRSSLAISKIVHRFYLEQMTPSDLRETQTYHNIWNL